MKTKHFPLENRRSPNCSLRNILTEVEGRRSELRQKRKARNADCPWEALSMKFRIEEEKELEQEVSVGSQSSLQADGEKPAEKEQLKFKGEQLTISGDTEAIG